MTGQVHERLILDGTPTGMAFCPPIPKNHPRIVTIDDEEARKSNPRVFSTACWRRYVGTWEIKNDRLYLIGLAGRFSLVGSEPLLADWFSGVLRAPRGKLLQYVHMGFGSVYEEEVHVEIDKGMVVKSRVIDNRGKVHDEVSLGFQNLPSRENRFPGDDKPFYHGESAQSLRQTKPWWKFWRRD